MLFKSQSGKRYTMNRLNSTPINLAPVPRTLRVSPFTLTDDDIASEHVYASRLFDALADRGVTVVDDPDDADIVHCFEVNFYTRTALSAFRYPELVALLRSETPVVVSTDDLYFTGDPSLTAHPRLYPLNHYTQRLLFRASDAVIAISESVRGNLGPHVADGILHVVRHGVDSRYTAAESAADPPFVLHVSIAAPRKNPDAIVETAQCLDAPFVVAGSDWGEHFADVPDTDNVNVRGYVPENDLIDLYSRAAIFYFPTRHEGFGLPVLEAMASNTAVVASDVYSVPEITGDAALLHDPDDVEAHVANINQLLVDDETRNCLANAARKRAEQFTWADAARRTEQVYEHVLEATD